MEEAPTEASNNAAEQHRDEVAAAAEAAPCHDRASEDAIAQDIDMQRKELIFGSILSSSLLRWFAHVKKNSIWHLKPPTLATVVKLRIHQKSLIKL